MQLSDPPLPADPLPSLGNLFADALPYEADGHHDLDEEALSAQQPSFTGASAGRRRQHRELRTPSPFQQGEPVQQSELLPQPPPRLPPRSPTPMDDPYRGVQYGRVATPDRYKDPLPDPNMDIEEGELGSLTSPVARSSIHAPPFPTQAAVSKPCSNLPYQEWPLTCLLSQMRMHCLEDHPPSCMPL